MSFTLEKLIAIHPKHPIEEVIFSVFVHQPIARLDKFFALQDKLHFNQVQQQENFIDSQKVFTGLEFGLINEKGQIQKLLQIKNKKSSSLISFHELAYTRWAEFKPFILEKVLFYLNEIHRGLYIDAISLTYIDTFRWENPIEAIPLKEIFNEDALPKSLYNSNDIFTLSLNKISQKNNREYNDQLDIDVRKIRETEPYTKLSVIHTVNLLAYTEDLGDILASSWIEQSLEFAHQINKEKMKELFKENIRLEKMNLKI